MAFIYLLADRVKWKRLRYAGKYLWNIFRSGQIEPYHPLENAGELKFAFSIPILFGVIAALYFPVR